MEPDNFAFFLLYFRHVESSCGREFFCEACGAIYRSYENLLTHGRRKGHVVDRRKMLERERKEMEKKKFRAVSGRDGGLVRIAPKVKH